MHVDISFEGRDVTSGILDVGVDVDADGLEDVVADGWLGQLF